MVGVAMRSREGWSVAGSDVYKRQFMEWIAIVFITGPVFAPVVAALAPELGLTPDQAKIWFGILFVMNIVLLYR